MFYFFAALHCNQVSPGRNPWQKYYFLLFQFPEILYDLYKSSLPEVFYKPLLKKRLWHSCFPVNFLQNTSSGCFWFYFNFLSTLTTLIDYHLTKKAEELNCKCCILWLLIISWKKVECIWVCYCSSLIEYKWKIYCPIRHRWPS